MRVLVVDDSSFARKKLALFFEREGFEVVMAEDGNKGLMAFESGGFDLITVDLLMPGMDGLELIREIRKKDDRVPVVVVSADIQESTKKEVIAAGATAFIGKVEDLSGILEIMKHTGLRPPEVFFTPERIDALRERLNISMGKAARALESLVEKRIVLQAPSIEIITDIVQLERFVEDQIEIVGTCVEQKFTGQLNGQAHLVFPENQASLLIKAIMEKEKGLDALSESERAVLTEVGNVVLNSAISTIGDLTRSRLRVSLPVLYLNLDQRSYLGILLSDIGEKFYLLVVVSRLWIHQILLTAYLLIGIGARGLILLIKALEGELHGDHLGK